MKRCHSNNRPDSGKAEHHFVSGKSRVPKSPTPERHSLKSKEKQWTAKKVQSNQHLLKGSSANKQQNVFPDSGSLNSLSCTSPDESPVVEVTVKTSNAPKQRSRSTVSDRQPWGQLLNRYVGEDNESAFGRFDPLRTLHFLARELQVHMQKKLPEETNLQEIIKAMHTALKRVPPEVASTIQLQQHNVDCISKLKVNSSECFDNVGYEKVDANKAVQTTKSSEESEIGQIQKLIEDSTMKLEASCKHLENICGQLRDEKFSLETKLQTEEANSKMLQTRVVELERTNKQLSQTLSKKDDELIQLKATVGILKSKIQEKDTTTSDAKSIIAELKKSKSKLEQEVSKLEHQLRVCAIEREKFLAILAVRDRQIHEIRNEMTQLQQAVNEQLVELHNCALSSVPTNFGGRVAEQDKEDRSISSIWTNDDDLKYKFNQSLKNIDLDDEAQGLPTQEKGVCGMSDR